MHSVFYYIKMARKSVYNVNEIIEKIDKYIEETELPIFKEVCYLNNWNSRYLWELASKNEELTDTIKKLTDKKEVELEKGGLSGKYVSTMAVFSLKQLGWKDRYEKIEEKSNADNTIKVEVVNNGNYKG